MARDELAFLMGCCIDCEVLELGSMIGQSAAVIGSVAKSLTCVDAWIDFCPFLEPRQAAEYKISGMEQRFDSNTYGLPIRKIKATTTEAAGILADARFDRILIDADHSYKAVRSDLSLFTPLLRPGGILLLHDYDSRAWPGVREAADEFGLAPATVVSSLGVFLR